MSKHEEDVNDGLTDEERAALAIEDESEKEVFDPDAEPSLATEPEAAPAAETEPAPAAEPEAAPAADPEPEAAPTPEAKPEPVAEKPVAAPAPVFVANAPEDAKAKLEGIATQKTELAKKWEDGEVTGSEYQAELDKLNEQAFDIKLAVRESEMANRMQQQQIENLWKQDCDKFLAQNTEYAPGSERLAALDASIRALAMLPTSNGMRNEDALAKAHNMVKSMYGEAVATPAAQAKPAAKQPVVPKPEIPPNIGNAPAAVMNDTTGGEFSSLTRLMQSGDVTAFETAFDNLTEAQQAKFLRS